MAQETPPMSERPMVAARPPRREGPPSPGGRSYGGPPGLRRPRRKVCSFCVDKAQRIDFKDVGRIRRYISERGKIDPRRKSGTCAKHQRMLTTALKRARLMALLPYTAEHVRAMMSPQARASAVPAARRIPACRPAASRAGADHDGAGSRCATGEPTERAAVLTSQG